MDPRSSAPDLPAFDPSALRDDSQLFKLDDLVALAGEPRSQPNQPSYSEPLGVDPFVALTVDAAPPLMATQAPAAAVLAPAAPARSDRRLVAGVLVGLGVMALATIALAAVVIVQHTSQAPVRQKTADPAHTAKLPLAPQLSSATTPATPPNNTEPTAKPTPEATKPARVVVAPERPAAKQPVAKRPVAKRPIAKRPVAKRPVAKRSVAKRPVAKRPIAKRPVATVPTAKSPTKVATTVEQPAKQPAKTKSELDKLIDGALGKKGKQPTTAAATPAKPLLAQLERVQIQRVIRTQVRPAVQRCFQRFHVPGFVNTRLTIAGKGRISALSVRGIFKATPTGRCVAKALQAARFPKFSGSPMTIDYPFVLR